MVWICVENIIRFDIIIEFYEILEFYCEFLLVCVGLLEVLLICDFGFEEVVKFIIYVVFKIEIKEF